MLRCNLLRSQARSTVLPGALEVLVSRPRAVALVHRCAMQIRRGMSLGRMREDKFRAGVAVMLPAIPGRHNLLAERERKQYDYRQFSNCTSFFCPNSITSNSLWFPSLLGLFLPPSSRGPFVLRLFIAQNSNSGAFCRCGTVQ